MEIVNMNGTVLLNVPGRTLRKVDLQGANLQYANLRKADLRDADLQTVNLWKANLQCAALQGADLRNADLRYADFQFANLQNADLREANLHFVDFSEAKLKGAFLPHFDETPVIQNIHKTIYEAASAPNALSMDLWHTCATTHCRGGWVVTLAGKAGKKLESKIGVNAAAALIYMKSDPELEQIPNWHASNEEALEDMRRLAS